jgi:hypothetical protein
LGSSKRRVLGRKLCRGEPHDLPLRELAVSLDDRHEVAFPGAGVALYDAEA